MTVTTVAGFFFATVINFLSSLLTVMSGHVQNANQTVTARSTLLFFKFIQQAA